MKDVEIPKMKSNPHTHIVEKFICPVCGTKIDGFDESKNFYYTICPKCGTKIANVNYLIEHV